MSSQRTTLTAPVGSLHRDNGQSRYGGMRTMDSSDRDRPVSYSSTSSSASSRDSHCSFSSGMTLVSNSPLGLNSQDKEAGAIKLELIPTRGLSNPEQCENNRQGNLNPVSIVEKQSTPATNTAAKRVESKGSHRNRATSPTATSATPKLLYVDRVVQEILETERTYVQDLKTIVQDYLDCITDQSRHPLGTEERSALFGNIRDIYHFNSELLQDLENCDSDPVAIAECFVAKSEEFHIYTQYCTNYPRSVAVLTECMRNKVLAKFFRERQETLKHSLPLGSYLLKPVQRILKYHLLLHEIVNHLDKDTECYDVVQDAIDTMQRVAWHINDMKRKHEHAVRLQEIQSLLTNWKGPDLTSYGELVLEGTFRIQRAKNERTLFLLDKLLLITKKREDMYTYKAHILCCNLMLVEVIPKEPLSFSVFHYKNPKVQHTVQAKSVQDKRLWILHLKRLILENHPAKIPAKAKQAILEMDAIHHPGFHYSPEGERRAAAHVREEGITPRRVRRKSEPSTRLKSPKQPETRQEKRASIEGSLLSSTVDAALSETTFSPKSVDESLQCSDTVNQSQESLEPAYPSDQEESLLQTPTLEQTDADDEEEAEQRGRPDSQQQMKGSRKRQNSQDWEDFDKRRSFNFSTSSLQSASTPSAKEPCQFTTSAGSAATGALASEWIKTKGISGSVQMADPRGACAVRELWSDAPIREILFPGQPLSRRNPEDDDYQMFMPAISTPTLNSTQVSQACTESSRPCSWHTEITQENPIPAISRRIVRRANSVKENHSTFRSTMSSNDKQGCPKLSRNASLCNSSPPKICAAQPVACAMETFIDLQSPAASSCESNLDITDSLKTGPVKSIYENVQLSEDLKLTGMRENAAPIRHGGIKVTDREGDKDRPCDQNKSKAPFKDKKLTTTRFTEIRRRAAANKSTACPQKEVDTTKCFTQTIGLCEKNHKNVKTDFKECTEKDNFLGPDIDIGCHDNMGRFVSEESLQFSGDDAPCLLGKGYLGWVDSSSNSNSLSHESVPDKLSEEVDEIWNDLENYIKKSEETKKDRLPAAFPVSKDDLNQPDCPQENSQNSTELQDLQPTTPITDNPSITKAVKNKLTRLSGTGFKSEEGDLRRDHSALNASSSSFVADGIVTESPLSGASSHISFTSSESLDHGLDIVDRTKRRVYYMARQYSQKIKRANQLLKRNPGEQSPSDHQKQKYKDLAAILEEKKQGGPAIGARIAEYSQLYDQIVFRETALKSQNTLNDCTGEMFGLNLESPLYSGCDTERQSLSTDDWFLHSTYSNGELADFVPWPNVQELKSKYVSPEKNAQLQRKLALTGLSTIVNSPVPCSPAYPQVLTQRWSTIISPPDKENLCQEQNYNSLGRRTSAGKPQLRSQSSTIGVSRSSDSITYTCQSEGNLLRASKSSSFDRPTSMATRSVDSLAYAGAQQHFCTEALGDSHSGLILQDSQKVLVVNRIPPLDAQTATQNYFANFNDTGEDDEDYVEIKSDDDYDELDDGPHTPDMSFEPQSNAKSTPKHIAFSSTSDLHSLSAPCTPVTSDINTSESLAALTSPDKLDDYLWRVPSPTQQNIVQTLREKFQCLSSSSFA
eukprot:gi/632953780/ref/XP_007892610.1/ PREDICTED: pleckstrin homology domain-containing family G member 1 isoform X2 [Callorhinchus milii]